MLRGNLSTRPFFNDRLVTLALAAVAVVALLLTVYNVSRLVTLSSERAQFRARITRDERAAADLRAQAQRLQQTLDRPALLRLSAATREANDLIDQRTFSWTVFFGLIEKTLPMDVRVVSVTPHVEKGVLKVALTVVARNLEDVSTFVDALLGTGSFYDVVPADQQAKDDGSYTAAIEASYLGEREPTPPPGAPAAPVRPVAPAPAPKGGGR